jgi:hypothetical protein
MDELIRKLGYRERLESLSSLQKLYESLDRFTLYPSLALDINHNDYFYNWQEDDYVKVAELGRTDKIYIREQGQIIQLHKEGKQFQLVSWDQFSKKLVVIYKKKDLFVYDIEITSAKNGLYHITIIVQRDKKTLFLSYNPKKKSCKFVSADYTSYLHSLGLETFIETSSKDEEKKSLEVCQFDENEGVYSKRVIKTPLPIFKLKTESNFVYVYHEKEAYQVLLTQEGDIEFLKIPLPSLVDITLLEGKLQLSHSGIIYQRTPTEWKMIQKLNSRATYYGKDEVILSRVGKLVTILFWYSDKFVPVAEIGSSDLDKLQGVKVLKPSLEQREKRLKQLKEVLNLPKVLILEVFDFCVW